MKNFGHRRGVVRLAYATFVLAVTLAVNVNAQTPPPGWTVTNIGNPTVGGSATFSSGTYSVSGSGADVGGSSDQFTFVHRQVVGDTTFIARVATFQSIRGSSEAGVMIRQSLSAGSKFAFANVTLSNGVAFQRRTTTGGSSNSTNGGSGAAPVWLKLERQSNTVTAFRSSNGTAWTQIGSATVSMTSTVYVGLAVSSRDPARTATSTFTNVTEPASALPAGWTASDVGAPSLAGSTQYASGTYTLEGAGEIGVQPGGTTDQFRFVYRQVTGDVDIRARVMSIENTNQWSKAGVMLRESLASNSVMGVTFISGGSVSAFQRRVTTGGSRQHVDGPAVTVPRWVRLERRGSLVTSSQSSDGVTWATISTMTLSTPTLYVGLAVTSATVSTLATGVFDNVVVQVPATNNQAPTVTLTAPADGAPFVAPASIGLAATASDTDGTIAQVTFYNGATPLTTDTSAPYSYTWTGVAAGSYSLTAVAQDNAGATTTSAARTVTVTAPLPNPPPVVTLTGPANGAVYTAPASIPITADASDNNGTVTVVEFYNGATMIGSDTTAPYAMSWNNVPAGTYALTALARDNAGATTTSAARTVTVAAALPNPPPVVTLTGPANGAVYTAPAMIPITADASDNNGTVTVVEFYNGTTMIGSDTTAPYAMSWNNVAAGTYVLTALARDNAGATTTSAARTVTVSSGSALPAGWTASDVGAPPLAGSTQYASGTYTLEGAGEIGVQPGGATDQFRFVYRQVTGDVDIRARVMSIENTNQWSKAGVMLRESLASNSVMGVTFISGGSVSAFQWRVTTGGSRQHVDGPAVTVPRWVRLERRGSLVTSSQSSDGVTWATISTMTLSTPTLYVGLAVTSATTSTLATGVFDNVVVQVPATTNQAPTVTLTAPADGAPFVAPASIGLAATASDTDGTIAQVTFYNGATPLTTDTSAPYSYTWTGVAAGSYSLTAVAQDNAGATTTSAARTVTVTAPLPNPPPVVTLTGPANGAVYTAPASIPITADASDNNGTVTVVEFYNGATMIGSDTTAPYAMSWNNVPAGTYALTALARDNAGATTTSAARTVTVAAALPNPPPVVTLTGPANGAVYTAPAMIPITADASDNNGTVTVVEFYNGTTMVGSDTTAPYAMSWNNVPAGTYALTAVARDNAGAMTVSGARDIRVDPATLPRTAIFTASTNHATAVDRYFLEIFPAGADPSVANPVATRDLGKPSVVGGEISVDVSTTTVGLAPGSYIATVTAIGSGGSARSAASPTFVR